MRFAYSAIFLICIAVFATNFSTTTQAMGGGGLARLHVEAAISGRSSRTPHFQTHSGLLSAQGNDSLPRVLSLAKARRTYCIEPHTPIPHMDWSR
jgi:hypothetical protein